MVRRVLWSVVAILGGVLVLGTAAGCATGKVVPSADFGAHFSEAYTDDGGVVHPSAKYADEFKVKGTDDFAAMRVGPNIIDLKSRIGSLNGVNADRNGVYMGSAVPPDALVMGDKTLTITGNAQASTRPAVLRDAEDNPVLDAAGKPIPLEGEEFFYDTDHSAILGQIPAILEQSNQAVMVLSKMAEKVAANDNATVVAIAESIGKWADVIKALAAPGSVPPVVPAVTP